MIRRNIFWGLAIFIGVFLIYLPMVAPSVAPQADSGELVTVGYFWSIAHPPGYPIYTFLAHLFTKLPWGEVAWRVNLLSTLLHSLTVFVIYLIVLRITKSVLAGVVSSLILAFSYTFWLYGLVAEVFPLNNLLSVLIVYLCILISEKKSLLVSGKILGFLGLLVGLGMSNHHTIVLVLPVVAYALYPLIWYQFKKGNYFFLIGQFIKPIFFWELVLCLTD